VDTGAHDIVVIGAHGSPPISLRPGRNFGSVVESGIAELSGRFLSLAGCGFLSERDVKYKLERHLREYVCGWNDGGFNQIAFGKR
jgi:hypothetical protein